MTQSLQNRAFLTQTIELVESFSNFQTTTLLLKYNLQNPLSYSHKELTLESYAFYNIDYAQLPLEYEVNPEPEALVRDRERINTFINAVACDESSHCLVRHLTDYFIHPSTDIAASGRHFIAMNTKHQHVASNTLRQHLIRLLPMVALEPITALHFNLNRLPSDVLKEDYLGPLYRKPNPIYELFNINAINHSTTCYPNYQNEWLAKLASQKKFDDRFFIGIDYKLTLDTSLSPQNAEHQFHENFIKKNFFRPLNFDLKSTLDCDLFKNHFNFGYRDFLSLYCAIHVNDNTRYYFKKIPYKKANTQAHLSNLDYFDLMLSHWCDKMKSSALYTRYEKSKIELEIEKLSRHTPAEFKGGRKNKI